MDAPTPNTDTSVAALTATPAPAEADPDYWHSLIDERTAGHFLGLVERTMQAHRQRGGGAKYIVLSRRCIRYRRIDLKAWADDRVRLSTSDPGPPEAA